MTALVCGIVVLAGFVGPILLKPDGPQGPLLGIFFTGSLAGLAGAILGFVQQRNPAAGTGFAPTGCRAGLPRKGG
jgi:hypothetical protein